MTERPRSRRTPAAKRVAETREILRALNVPREQQNGGEGEAPAGGGRGALVSMNRLYARAKGSRAVGRTTSTANHAILSRFRRHAGSSSAVPRGSDLSAHRG